jgi:PPOX class probable F420-dependent enzyme
VPVLGLSEAGLEFVTVRHLATLATLRGDGTPHVTPVGFTWDADAGLARVICSGTSQKARNAERDARVAITQVDGRLWLTLEGAAVVSADPDRVHDAEQRYAARYRQPRENPQRVVIEVVVTRMLGTADLRG